MSAAIKVENISKAYRLGEIGTGSLSNDLHRWWIKQRGKEDPYLTIGEENVRTSKGTGNIVWSLKDINFEIQQGQAVGIIGRNGAGKSTLLKILSKVTSPTTGNISGVGRIASLLEVGTGFHPELTGRENIYLNGAILGMRKKEITRHFDAIVDFSGVERYIDTPVKRYSSGMYVRLAFAVAAHLESEILIIDEVLAVGDAEFQKKCLGKMDEVSKGEGRTILFVSHNMGAIKNLCSNVIILNNGKAIFEGGVNIGIQKYIEANNNRKTTLYKRKNNENRISYVEQIEVTDKRGVNREEFSFEEEVIIRSRIHIDPTQLSAKVGFKVLDNHDRCVFTTEIDIKEFVENGGIVDLFTEIPANVLVPNIYKIQFGIHIPNMEIIELLADVVHFTILETGSDFFQYSNYDNGCVFVNCLWSSKTKLINEY